MNNKGAALTSNFLNKYDELQFRYKGSDFYDDKLWTDMYKSTSQDLDTYINLLGRQDKLDKDYMESKYNFSELSSYGKLGAMTAELDANRTDKKNYSFVVGYDEYGKEKKETYNLTEYEYYQRLLETEVNAIKEKHRLDLLQEQKDNLTIFEKLWNTNVALFGEFALGATDFVYGLFNLIDAVANADDLQDFRSMMSDTRLGQLDTEWYSNYSSKLRDWENRASYLGKTTGERTWLGRTLGSAAYSIGQGMAAGGITSGISSAANGVKSIATAGKATSKLLNASKTVLQRGSKGYTALYRTLFYTGVSSAELTEKFKDPAYDSTSTMAIVGETALKATGQVLVESSLEKFLGGSYLDELTHGVTAGKSTKYPILNAVFNVAKEGAEEGLQEFSDWAIDAIIAHGDENNPFYSKWSWQNFGDAIISGMMASAVSGITNSTIKSIQAAKAINKLGIKDTEAYKQISDKYSKRKYAKNVFELLKNYSEIVNSADYIQNNSDEQFQLTQQMYNSFNIIMSMYGSMGQERASKAEQLLKELETAYNNKYSEFSKQSRQYATSLITSWENISSTEKINTDTSNRIKEKLNKLKKNKKISDKTDDTNIEIRAGFDNGKFVGNKREISKLTDKATKTAEELAKNGTDVLITNDKRVIGDDEVITISADNLNNMSVQEIAKAAAEDDVVTTLANELGDRLIADVANVYQQIYAKSKNDSIETILYKLLYDGSTFNTMLLHSSSGMFKFMVTLDKILESVSKRDLTNDFNKQYLIVANKLKNNLGKNVIIYLCNHIDVSYDDLQFLTKEQQAFIERNRYNGYVRMRVADGKTTEQDENILSSRINSAPFATNERKNKLRTDLKSNVKGVRLRALRELDEMYDYAYFGVFNDIIYPAGTDIKNCIFTDFLMTNNLDLRYFKNGVINDDLKQNVINSSGVYNEVNKIAYLTKLFETFTGNNYTLKFSRAPGTTKIIDVLVQSKTDLEYNYTTGGEIARLQTDIVVTPKTTKLATDILSENLNSNLTIVEKAYITFDDVIKYPNKYLSKETLSKIKNDYGIINKNSVLTYFREVLSNKDATIVETIDGNYTVAVYNHLDNFVKDKLDITKLVYDKNYTAEDFYKIENIPEELRNVNIIFEKNLYNPYYSQAEKTIHLPKPVSKSSFKTTLMHEMYHAMSVLYNFSAGFSSSIPVTQEVVNDVKRHVPDLFENVNVKDYFKTVQNYIYANVSGELLAYGTYNIVVDVVPIVFDNKTNTLKMPWGTKYYVGDKVSLTPTNAAVVKEELDIKGDKGGKIEVLDDEKIKAYNHAFTKGDLLNPKSVEFKRMLTYYRKRYLEINVKSGWSGYLGDENMEKFIYDEHKGQDREDLRRYYWLEKFNNVTYEEFLEMDLPFIRYNEAQKLSPKKKIRRGVTYKYRTHYSAFNGTDYKLLLDYFKLNDTVDGTKDYLYFGTIKPKDVPVMIPSGERELLIPENVLLNNCTIVPIKYIDGVAYVYEQGDKPVVYLTNNVKKKILNKIADVTEQKLKQSVDVWISKIDDRRTAILPEGVDLYKLVKQALLEGGRSFIPISTNNIVSPYYISDTENNLPIYQFPVNVSKLDKYINRFNAADEIRDYLKYQCITFGKDYISLPPAFLKLTPTKAYDVMERLPYTLTTYYNDDRDLKNFQVIYLTDDGKQEVKVYETLTEFHNEYFKNIHYITEITNKQGKIHSEMDYFHNLSPERLYNWRKKHLGVYSMLTDISHIYDGDVNQSEGIVLHEMHVPLSNTPSIRRTQLAILNQYRVTFDDTVGKTYLKPYGYFKTVDGITTTYTLKKDVPVDKSDTRVTKNGEITTIDNVKRKIVTKKQIDEKLLEFNTFDYKADFDYAKVLVKKLIKFLDENKTVLTYEKLTDFRYENVINKEQVFILPGGIAVYPNISSFAGFSSDEILNFITTRLSESERLTVKNNTLEVYSSIYYDDVRGLNFNEEFLSNIRNEFLSVVNACFEQNLGVAVVNSPDDDFVFTNDEYIYLDVYDMTFNFSNIKQEAAIKPKKDVTKQEYDEAVDYITKINNATQGIKNAKDPEKYIAKYDLPDETKQKILDNTYYKSKDATYSRLSKIKRAYEAKQAIFERKKAAAARKKAATTSDDKRVAISKKLAGETNLKYFVDKPYPIQRRRNFINFVVDTTDDLDKLPEELSDGILKGTLSQDDIYQYIRTATEMNDYTFDMIKKHFFPNTPFNSYKDLSRFLTVDLPYLQGVKAALIETGNEDLLSTEFKYDDYVTYVENGKTKKLPSIVVHFLNIDETKPIVEKVVKNFNVGWSMGDDGKWSYGDLDINYGNGQLIALKYFTGTVFDASIVANKMKWATRMGYATTAAERGKTSLDKSLTNAKGEEGDTLHDLLGEDETTTSQVSLEDKRRHIIEKFGLVLEKTVSAVSEKGKLELDDVEELMYLIKPSYINLTKKEKSMYASKVLNKIYNVKTNKFDASAMKEFIKSYAKKITNLNENEVNFIYTKFNLAEDFAANEIVIDEMLKAQELNEGNRTLKTAKDTYNNLVYRNIQYVNTKNYNYLPDEYKKFFVVNKNKVAINKDLIKGKSVKQIDDLRTELKTAFSLIRKGYFENIQAVNMWKRLEREREKRLKAEKKSITKISKDGKVSYVTNVASKTFEIQSNVPIPDKLKTFLDTTFDKERKSTTKFMTSDDEKHMVISSIEFFKRHSDELDKLTVDEVEEIVNYYSSAIVLPGNITDIDLIRFDAFKTMLYAHFIGEYNAGKLLIDDELVSNMKSQLEFGERRFATNLTTWRHVLKYVDPDKVHAQQVFHELGIELEDGVFDSLYKAVRDGNLEQIQSEQKKLYERMLKEYKGSGHKLRQAFDKIKAIQRAAQLSGPATIVRAHTSNMSLQGINKLSDWIASKLAKGSKKAYTLPNQYNLTGVKVTEDVKTWIDDELINNGYLDLITDGLSKFDIRDLEHKNSGTNSVVDLIVTNITSNIKTQNVLDNKYLSKWTKIVSKLQSDAPYIKKQFKSYLGRILVSTNVDYSQGIKSPKVLDAIVSAYNMAAYDYVHRKNWISDVEGKFAQKAPKAYMCYKLVMPYMPSTYNWFVEMLDLTPFALIKNIHDLCQLEKKVAAMENLQQKGEYVPYDPRFVEMITRRKVGKGVLGTILFALGIGLGALGLIDVDDEDDKLKLFIPGTDIRIDISKQYGTSSLLIGAQFANPTKGDWFNVIEDVFNMTLEDWTLTSIIDTFRYSNGVFDALSEMPINVASGFIPNLYKAVVRMINYKKISYSKGFVGNLEYLAYSLIPGSYNWLSTSIDPYTGEEQVRYSNSWYVNILNEFLPTKLYTYKISNSELVARSYGVNKTELKGEYEDTGKLDKVMLNKKYGELNKKDLDDFINNKTTYEVENENGKKVKLNFSKMNDEQKESVLNRIMTKNAQYAKIYVWTQSGHKYYCSSSKRAELIKVGITQNILIGNKGFVN